MIYVSERLAAAGPFIKAGAAFLAELNAIHPFREGNPRPAAWKRTKAELLQNHCALFKSEDQVDQCASALLRTGFVVSLHIWDTDAMGATMRLRRLVEMAAYDMWADENLE